MGDKRSWDATWEVHFPASTVDELMLALVVRDMLHGTSFDVDGGSGGVDLAVDFLAGDELEEDSYRLLVTAEVVGSVDAETVQQVTEILLEQLVDEAERVVGSRRLLASTDLSSVRFDPVPEDEERWDLVVPDWLAPDGAEVPFGFRPASEDTGSRWPTDAELDAHGRVILVPFEGEAHLFAIPAPTDDEEDPNALPVIS